MTTGTTRRYGKRTDGALKSESNGRAKANKTRDNLLRSATKAFSKNGFAGASVEGISREARSHDNMIYYYFGSKEKLFVAVLEQAYDKMNEAEGMLDIDPEDPVAALRTIALFPWTYYQKNPDLIALLNSENLQKGKHISRSPTIKEHSSPALRILERILAKGVEKGLFNTDLSARDLYMTIMALSYFYLSNRYTLSAYFGVDLMTREEMNHWEEVVPQVILKSVLKERPRG